ncbi:MAG: Pre-mRNA-splicing factor of RES complex-domain-containing protein [Podila humilis]|nr:MAG: Pre-mRNA-splicing factor of RES complex-domain-containing protein [Podila humilis]
MSSGAKAGLQTAEQVKRDTDRRQQEYLDRMRALDPSKSGRDAETVYRDAQGRKVDRVAEKIEAAAAKRREIEKQERQMEWGKGLVQREEEQARKKRMEEEKFKPLARYKDDEELNEELKDRDRWNDPAAMFLTGVKKSKKAAPKFPLYQGNFPPNRYNIRPGYRWDGVDRSNGFEKDYFMRMNTKQHNAREAHMWSTEDM